MVTTIKETAPKARKIHKCDWCGLNIQVGQVYESAVLKCESKIYAWKNHVRCRDLVLELDIDASDIEFGISKDDFQEAVTEAFADMQKDFDDDFPSFEIQLNAVCDKYLKD